METDADPSFANPTQDDVPETETLIKSNASKTSHPESVALLFHKAQGWKTRHGVTNFCLKAQIY